MALRFFEAGPLGLLGAAAFVDAVALPAALHPVSPDVAGAPGALLSAREFARTSRAAEPTSASLFSRIAFRADSMSAAVGLGFWLEGVRPTE